ncbi:MAG TPA: hypothetical protein VMV83_12495 [Rectinemataceae bacterium]|nr:hypothetical protein [Rectinemataceae bacterium]
MKKISTVFVLAAMLGGSLVFAQTDQAPKPFQAGISLGTDVFNTGPVDPTTGSPTPEAWTQLGFQPDVAFGKFGVGLNLTFHFQVYPVNYPDQAVRLYDGDWVAGSGANALDWASLYLSKLLYVRYGLKGQDPLFVKVGSISDFTLGNGFIMGSYSNMSFFPQTRFTGVDFGIDGSMFNFPMVGLELLTSNLARFDVVGAHVVVRPLIGTDLGLFKNLQAGLTVAADTDPGVYYSLTNPGSLSSAYSGPAVAVFGLDASLPLLNSPMATATAFTEAALEPNGRAGYMLGAGGKLVSLFLWGAQLRLLGPGFIPTYFDANYDIYRNAKAVLMESSPTGSASVGWFATIGASLLGDKVSSSISLDGPFAAGVVGDTYSWPHLRAVAHLGEGLLPGIYADASYEKYALGSVSNFFSDIVDPTDAIVGLSINYRTGSSVLSLLYNAKWMDQQWKVSSSLQASVKF